MPGGHGLGAGTGGDVGGEDDHRHEVVLVVGAQAPVELQAVEPAQPQVEEHRVGPVLDDGRHAFVGVAGVDVDDVVAAGAEVGP